MAHPSMACTAEDFQCLVKSHICWAMRKTSSGVMIHGNKVPQILTGAQLGWELLS